MMAILAEMKTVAFSTNVGENSNRLTLDYSLEKATMTKRRPLLVADILRWAESHRETTGQWPSRETGVVLDMIDETWAGVDRALREGLRGLPGNSSLLQFLVSHGKIRQIHRQPPLTEEQILAWADVHHRSKGKWPTVKSGVIHDSHGEKWKSINHALDAGIRGLPGGSSLAKLLAARRGARNHKGLPPMTEEQILVWADRHNTQRGTWPNRNSGQITDAPGETWMAVDMALHQGNRGLPGGSSLALLLAEKRNVRNVWTRPDLSVQQILAWADAHQQEKGTWPNLLSGAVVTAQDETWSAINHALTRGSRGLPGGFSLAELLHIERGVPIQGMFATFTLEQILAWATAHHTRTGKWPIKSSGPVAESPEETWSIVDDALRNGHHGLEGGSSLARFLAQHGKKRNRKDLPRLSKKKILVWADAHKERNGKWPTAASGSVQEAPEETWDLIDHALRQGQRGLESGSSLVQLLAKKRQVRNPLNLPALTEGQILGWAEWHFQREGTWPKYTSGPIAAAPGETWAGVDKALRYGRRGLPGKISLAKLLARHRDESGERFSESSPRRSDSLKQAESEGVQVATGQIGIMVLTR
jgi:hypothetical protein